MKSAPKTFIVYGLLFFFSVAVIPYLIVQKRVNEYSDERNIELLRRWYETMFKVYISREKVDDNKALLITNGRAEYKGEFPDRFTVIMGDTFSYGFDPATQVEFIVKKITKNGLHMTYDFTRDYNVFGRDLVINYTSPLILQWTKNK